MNIGYIIDIGCCVSSFNGIRMQAQVWAEELIRRSNHVVFINPWEKIEWKSLDIIHIFGQNENVLGWCRALSQYKIPIVLSPIIDTIQSVQKYRMAASLNIPFLRLSSVNNKMKRTNQYISMWFARSEYEVSYITGAYCVPVSKTALIPLSFRTHTIDCYPIKKNYCLHVSKITDGRKNVMRLMKAAIKYNFELVLAGSNQETEFGPFKEVIDANDNITYLGRVSEEKLIELYKEAKVFALPSINEGVGLVALEAASFGCDIVITEIGGPHEYYGGLCYMVNPYSIDNIGESVIKALEGKTFQPRLKEYITSNYNIISCVDSLLDQYKKVIKGIEEV